MKTLKHASIIFALLILSGISLAIVKVGELSLPYVASKQFDGRGLKLVRVLAGNAYYTRYYITYMSGKYRISGIMNVPKGGGPYPAVVLDHGYINTKYYTNGRGLKREQDYLARHGYVVLHTDYRNHNGSDSDPDNELNLHFGYTEDVINAVYAIKGSDLDFIDKGNIGMLGHSLGGGLCLNVMVTRPGLVKAYVLFAPMSDDFKKNYDRWIAKHWVGQEKYGQPSVIKERFGSPETNPQFWYNLSPKNFINNVTDPVEVHQGLADKSVPPEWASDLKSDFERAGKRLTLFTYRGEPHEFINSWPLVMERTVEFFDGYLK